MNLHSYCRKKLIFSLYISFLITVLSVISYNKTTVLAQENSSYPSLFINKSYDDNELKTEVERIFNKRSSAFVTGDLLSLKELYDTSQKVWYVGS